jgi:hypothetical protein
MFFSGQIQIYPFTPSKRCAMLRACLGGDWRLLHSPLTVSENGMPRIPEDFLEAVVYLYRSTHEAEEGIEAGGSGFLVSVSAETVPDGKFHYIVTNRHVIASADVIRFNTKAGGTHVERFPRERWWKSKTDDLAICLLAPQGELWAQKTIPFSQILSEDKAAAIRLGIGDAVFMIGRFINHEGRQQNAPLVRFGGIAQMPSDPLRYPEGLDGKPHEQLSIIADIRSIGGYSGSPVFLNEPEFILRPKNGEATDKHYLIGIDWGHIPMWSPVCGLNQKPLGQTQVNVNSGMAGVVPSWRLIDLLMSDEPANERKLYEARYHATKLASNAALDLGGVPSAPPASDENPSHREDFMRLVGAAARKREQED